ncbi:MAG: hypothetical protein AB1714_18610 [Acidobacteriota bacterium]
MQRNRRIIFSAAIVLAITLPACGLRDRLTTTPIGDILKSPREYEGKTVTVSGVVADEVSLIAVKYFTVEDKTGRIAVVTNRIMPAKGEKVRVRGAVQEMFSLGTRRIIVIKEEPPSETQR